MVEKRILIASYYPLFDEGINTLLLDEPGIEVVGVVRGDLSDLERQAIDLRTDVILILGHHEQTSVNTFRLLDIAANCVIKVDTGHNRIQIYRRQELLEGDLEDVMMAIRADC